MPSGQRDLMVGADRLQRRGGDHSCCRSAKTFLHPTTHRKRPHRSVPALERDIRLRGANCNDKPAILCGHGGDSFIDTKIDALASLDDDRQQRSPRVRGPLGGSPNSNIYLENIFPGLSKLAGT